MTLPILMFHLLKQQYNNFFVAKFCALHIEMLIYCVVGYFFKVQIFSTE